MRRHHIALINTSAIELWPAQLLKARTNRDARALSQADIVLRRKQDGAYLAAGMPAGILPLVPRLMQEAGIDEALDVLEHLHVAARPSDDGGGCLPIDGLLDRLAAMHIDPDDYAARTGLAPVAEPTRLTFAGRDRYRRPLWLRGDAARAWTRMQRAARHDAIDLDAISGYRSHAYQAGIVARKCARGQTLDAILQVNAAPGFSEHHSGRALDIGTPGEPPAEASFESTAAFAWLRDHAATFDFTLSYPRDNSHGIVFEPWHWAYGSA